MSELQGNGSSLVINGYPEEMPWVWTDILTGYSDQMGGFDSNAEHAGLLLAAFGRGRGYIRDYFADKVTVRYPNIHIMYDELPGVPPIFDYISEAGGNEGTVIRKSFLVKAAQYDPYEIKDFYGKKGAIALQATCKELFFLAGVEETHHALFRKLNPQHNEPASRNELTGPEYNALENEWQALHFRIKAAWEFDLANEVVSQLLRTRDEALEVRQSHGLNTSTIPFL